MIIKEADRSQLKDCNTKILILQKRRTCLYLNKEKMKH